MLKAYRGGCVLLSAVLAVTSGCGMIVCLGLLCVTVLVLSVVLVCCVTCCCVL
jgi:hypothetical protein